MHVWKEMLIFQESNKGALGKMKSRIFKTIIDK